MMTSGGIGTRHRTWRRSAVVATCVLAMSVASAVSTPRAGASTGRPALEQTKIAWTRCAGEGPQLQCAKVAVPLDWTRPRGQHIELAVIRHLASRPQNRIGSMFIDPGGPGQSGVDFVLGLGTMLDAWGGGRFDVVSWDPRGTSRSSPVQCFTSQAEQAQFWRGVSIPTTPAESPAYQRKTVELARRCGEVSGQLLAHISTTDTARDLDALRHLVGDRKLTYVGLSYGTMIGQIYANLFPGRVRAMMLDGLVDAVEYTANAERRVANQAEFSDEVFAEFVSLCQQAGASGCALARHSETVAHRVARLFATARRAPIPATNAKPPGVLSYSDLLLSTFTPLRLPGEWPDYAKALDAAASGDASDLEEMARPGRTPEGFAGATTSSAISCVDAQASRSSRAWPSVIPHLTQVSKLWGPVLGWWLWAPCASNWPAHSDDRYAGPWNAKTKNPILLLNNLHDPATGYRNALVAEQRLGQAVLLTEIGYGHLTLNDPSRCVERARKSYLVDLMTPPRGTVCLADQPPFP
jgi:pimeloyl-ACP methyl ester carboxylesterase